MKISPQDLSAAGYELLDQLDHDDLVPFLKRSINYNNSYIVAYNSLLALWLILLLLVYFYLIHTGTVSWHKGLLRILTGISLPFLTIPLHELIHLVAYKLIGAPRTSIYVNLKKFYFAAVADQFVVNRKEFYYIALAPFVLLFVLFAVPLYFLSPTYQLIFLAAIFVHFITCSGDIALISYFKNHADKELVTYDDSANKITYFYAK